MADHPVPDSNRSTDPARNFATYYGRPQVKPAPFNNWIVGGYIFLAGLSGSAQLLSTLADLCAPRRAERLVRRGRFLSLLAPTLGSALLIYDLHTPQRFYNMLRIVRHTSPMSIGTWILTVFGTFGGITAGLQFLQDRIRPRNAERPRTSVLRGFARTAQVPAAFAGAGLGTYTAALLSATSTPLWAAAPRALAVRFASSSLASGAAALAIGERHAGDRRLARDLDALALAALVVEMGAATTAERSYVRQGISAARDARPGMTLDKLGSQALGVALPIGMQAVSALSRRRRPLLEDVASLAILAGGLFLRVAVMEAGDESARRPQDSLRFARPENLPRRRS